MRTPCTHRLILAYSCGATSIALLFCVIGCGTEKSVNTESGGSRLSQASNNCVSQGAWAIDQSNLDERWDEDPTVMEPDFPYGGAQPGFSTFSSDND